MEDVHEGGCLCGKVRYRTVGKPRWQAACHCRFCQRASGSAFSTQAYFVRDNVQISGSPRVYEHRSPDHGRALRSQFCPHCGVAVALAFERFPLMQAIHAGTYDDAGWIEVDKHIFTASAMKWIAYSERTDVYSEHQLRLDGTLAPPVRHGVQP